VKFPTPELETDRLILRAPRPEDFDAWAESCADPVVMTHLGGAQPRSVAWRTMCVFAGAWMVNGFSMFSVIEKETGRWVGRLGPWRPEGWPGTEVGWGLARAAWGKGYATEGATAAIDWAFDTLGWDEVIHSIAPANVESQGVAKRLGSRILRQAPLPAPLQDVQVDIWGQSRAAWQARRA
jgi:RimJ/RimL family protein N-acetyltransferase